MLDGEYTKIIAQQLIAESMKKSHAHTPEWLWTAPTNDDPDRRLSFHHIGNIYDIRIGCDRGRQQCYLQFKDIFNSAFVYNPRFLTKFKRQFPKTVRQVEFRLCPARRDPKIPRGLCVYS